MKQIFLLLGMMMISGAVFGQSSISLSNGGMDFLSSNLQRSSMGTQSIESLISKGGKEMSAKQKKELYLEQEWLEGIIYLDVDKKLSGLPIKYNVLSRLFEIKKGDQIKILSDSRVEAFTWNDLLGNERKYVSARNIEQSFENHGFFEIVESGTVTLLSYKTIEITDSNYNTALQIGSKEKTYSGKEKYYLLYNNVVKEMNRKKDLLKSFGEQSDKMHQYMKNSDLSIRKRSELANIVRHYNSVLGSK